MAHEYIAIHHCIVAWGVTTCCVVASDCIAKDREIVL